MGYMLAERKVLGGGGEAEGHKCRQDGEQFFPCDMKGAFGGIGAGMVAERERLERHLNWRVGIRSPG